MADNAVTDLASRARATIVGLIVGDILGAAVEGWSPDHIAAAFGPAGPPDFVRALHMGMPEGFVGPSDSPTARHGMYTDDSCATLCVAEAIVELGRVDCAAIARCLATQFLRGEPRRFCPPTALALLRLVDEGENPRTVALDALSGGHFPFPGGSFANGGAMRIVPVALAAHRAAPSVLRSLVTEALRCSHTHPEAVDAAVVQAEAVRYALRCPAPSAFSPSAFLEHLAAVADSPTLHSRLRVLAAAVEATNAPDSLKGSRGCLKLATGIPLADAAITADLQLLSAVLELGEQRSGSGLDFQIAAVDAVPCAMLAVARCFASPEATVRRAVSYGGDTDTIASMAGAIVGALHGSTEPSLGSRDDTVTLATSLPFPARWVDSIEGGPRGLSFALSLAELLVALDIT